MFVGTVLKIDEKTNRDGQPYLGVTAAGDSPLVTVGETRAWFAVPTWMAQAGLGARSRVEVDFKGADPGSSSNFWFLKRARVLTIDGRPLRSCGDRPAPAPGMPGFERAFELIETASKSLRDPKVRLVDGDLKVKLWRLSEASQTPGHAAVCEDARRGEWWGRIDPEGRLHLSRRGEARQGLLELLQALAADPAEMLAAMGRATGACCLCGRHLTDERSLHYGYGPTCAENYGLPWG